MELLNPEFLLVWILVPILAVSAVFFGRYRGIGWDVFSAERLKGKLVKSSNQLPRWMAFGMLLGAIVAIATALARPQGDSNEKVEKTKVRNVMILLDLSRSMDVEDVKPNRLSQAKVLVYELLEKLKDDRVGLVGFAGTPLLVAPLTIDHAAVKETVEEIDGTWLSTGGSNLASALQLGTETLKQTGQKTNAMILISDGEEHTGELDDMLREAERAGVVIMSVGMGTTDGGFVPNKDFSDGFMRDVSGNKVLSTLEPDILKKLSSETGGRYVLAGQGGNIPEMVKLMMEGMDAFEMEGVKKKVVVELYQWALLPAIFFLMLSVIAGTRWRPLPGLAIFLFFIFVGDNLKAGQLEDAKRAFQEGKYDVSRDVYHGLAEKAGEKKGARYRLGEGLAAYEAGDYRSARSAFSGAMLSEDPAVIGEAHEGLGNTLFQLGWMGLAGSKYPKGGSVPDMDKFDELVKAQLQRLGDAEIPEKGDKSEFVRIESILLNWSDAVRHYRSAEARNPNDAGPNQNGEMVMAYLIRLRDLLQEEKKQQEQELMEMQSQMQSGEGEGEGEPKEGEGEEKSDGEGEEQEGDGKSKKGQEDKKGNGDPKDDKEGNGGKNKDDKKGEGEGDEKDKKDSDDKSNTKSDPNKSPEDLARERLRENSDLQRGPLRSGRQDYSPPKKDW